MAKLQKQLITFHNSIRVEEEDLRTSRDALLEKIKKSLGDQGHPMPALINQGSYIYGVGIEPTEPLEHDIDTGLEFNVAADEQDPKKMRDWVYDAVKGHTDQLPEKKGPCIRVKYKKGYHVDLVTYAKYKTKSELDADRENHRIAMKDGSWKPSEPKKLKKHILDSMDKFNSTKVQGEGNQLQRVVRSLKRWNDLAMPFESEDKPIGLAILLFCIDNLTPTLDLSGEADDLSALESVAMKAKNTIGRIIVKKPTQEFEDVFARISDKGMNDLKARFLKLHTALVSAKQEKSLKKACDILAKEFGADFPIDEDPKEESKNSNTSNLIKAAAQSSTTQVKPWSK